MRFFGSYSRKIASHLAMATRTSFPDRVRLFARERENVVRKDSMRRSIGFPRRTACHLSG
jgi:hypothetical protein